VKKILFLIPEGLKEGQPSYERIYSFVEFYKQQNVKTQIYIIQNKFMDNIRLILFIYRNSIKNIFISMPPFRNWFLFFLLGIRIIFDIRDGWSIAIKTGYGGLVKPNKIKASLCKFIEKTAIKRSYITITCTLGLQEYLKKISQKNVLLITNGSSQKDIEIIETLRTLEKKKTDSSTNIAVCVGKFSEYGRDKVKLIFHKINKLEKKTVIKLIGSDINSNSWISEWLLDNGMCNIEIDFLHRMDRRNIFIEVINADFGLSVIRDPSYDYGTKVFDYINCSIPMFNYFEEENYFTVFFKGFFYGDNKILLKKSFIREQIINEYKEFLIVLK